MTKPGIPASLNVTDSASTMISDIKDNSNKNLNSNRLIERSTRSKAEITRLKATSANSHTLITGLIEHIEKMVTATPHMLNITARLSISIENMHFRSIQAEDYIIKTN